jgi:hypothetical protein
MTILLGAGLAMFAACSKEKKGNAGDAHEQGSFDPAKAATSAPVESDRSLTEAVQPQAATPEEASNKEMEAAPSPSESAEPSEPVKATAIEPKTEKAAEIKTSHGWFANRVVEAPMGDPRARRWLDSRKSDPEFESVITGKRKVSRHDIQLDGGEKSPEDLARRIVTAVCAGDKNGLRELMVNADEYEKILWPEFPQSRPATNWTAPEAWHRHLLKANSGADEGLESYSGKDLIFDSVTCDRGCEAYTNFNLYRDIHIHTHTPEGGEVTMSFAVSFVERNGTWKVHMYKD